MSIETSHEAAPSGGGARWRREAAEIRARLRRLRDQARVRAHLAGMELRRLWERLEARRPAIERRLERAGAQGRKAAEELATRMRELRSRLDGRRH